VCRYARDEKEVREVLEAMWKNSSEAKEILAMVVEKNKDVYKLEEMLER